MNQNLLNVYDKIDSNGFSVVSLKIPFKAAVVEIDGRCGIFYNEEITDPDEKFMILSHEYGHCKSGATHHINSPYELISKHEYIADKTSVLELLPFEKIEEAISKGCNMAWQIAEYLDIPYQFVEKAIKVYTNMGFLTG